jgi:hypothetical protein
VFALGFRQSLQNPVESRIGSHTVRFDEGISVEIISERDFSKLVQRSETLPLTASQETEEPAAEQAVQKAVVPFGPTFTPTRLPPGWGPPTRATVAAEGTRLPAAPGHENSSSADRASVAVPVIAAHNLNFENLHGGVYRPSLSMFEREAKLEIRGPSEASRSARSDITVTPEFRQTRRVDGPETLGLFRGDPLKWQENKVAYLNLQIGTDAVRLKTRFGGSSYEASGRFFEGLSSKKSAEERRTSRFGGQGFDSGGAFHSRVEVDVLQLQHTTLTTFAEYANVSRWFEDLRFSDKSRRKETREDLLSTPGIQTERAGVILKHGPLGISLAGSQFRGDSAEDTLERRLETKAWLNLKDAFTSSAASPALPASIWIAYDQGGARSNKAMLGSWTMANTLDLGLYWGWGNSFASLSAWQSVRAEDQPGRSPDWSGEGADLDLGVRGEKWTLSGRLSLSRSKSDAQGTRSRDANLDAGAAFTWHPDSWPRITFAVDTTSYAGIFGDAMQTDSRVVQAGVALDFSPYIAPRYRQPAGTRLRKLALVYSARMEAADFASSSQTARPDHFIGVAVQFGADHPTPLR